MQRSEGVEARKHARWERSDAVVVELYGRLRMEMGWEKEIAVV